MTAAAACRVGMGLDTCAVSTLHAPSSPCLCPKDCHHRAMQKTAANMQIAHRHAARHFSPRTTSALGRHGVTVPSWPADLVRGKQAPRHLHASQLPPTPTFVLAGKPVEAN